MRFTLLSVSLVGLMAMFAGSSPNALATACPATPTCTAGGTTFTPGDDSSLLDAPGATEIDDGVANGMTPIAQFATANQSNATIAAEVEAYLADLGVTGVTYLGRSTGGASSGGPSGTGFTVSSSDGGLSGTWTFSPGNTGDTASFVAIHAGGGQGDILYQFNTQSSLSGVWDTSENINGGGQQGALSNFDLFSGVGSGIIIIPGGGGATPEPGTLAVLGTGLVALALYRRRRTS